MADPKPCPFCEGDAEVQKANIREGADPFCAWVRCLACRAEGPLEDTPEQAIEKWNRAVRP